MYVKLLQKLCFESHKLTIAILKNTLIVGRKIGIV